MPVVASQQGRLFVSLTSHSFMVSMTACLMKKETMERRTRETTLSLSVCVVFTCYLIPCSLWKRHSVRERPAQSNAGGRGGGGGVNCREKRSGAAIPRHPGNQRSFKENRPMVNTGNCVQTKSHMTTQSPLPVHWKRREKKKRSTVICGEGLIKEEK